METTKHTPGPRAKTCGCMMEPVKNDERDECDLCSEAMGANDGTGWVIVYCPLHAAAPDLLAALESTVEALDRARGYDCDNARKTSEAAHVAITKAKGL